MSAGRSRRSWLSCLLFLMLAGGGLAGCSGAVLPPPAFLGPVAITAAMTSPSATPFQPTDETATVADMLVLPSPSLSPILTATATTPSPVSSATPLDAVQESAIPGYRLDASLDYAAHTLSVEETISYPNAAGAPLSSLVLAVEADRWIGCFELHSLAVDGQTAAGFTLDGIRLEVPLASPLQPGAMATLSLQYDLHLPEADIRHVFGYNARQANLTDWYPFVVPYVPGTGWLLHQPGGVGEHLVYDPADFDVTLRASDGGKPLVIAASAPGEQAGGAWHYLLAGARTFVFSASPEYAQDSTTVDAVTVTSYYFPNERTAAHVVLSEVARAVDTYGRDFGPYRHASLSIVEAVFDDGMEYDGLFFLSRNFYTAYNGTKLNYLVAIGVHETAHQWWFAQVGNDQALEPWLDEALAIYCERIFYQANYPSVTGWWAFRVTPYAPTGWVDTSIYQAAGYRPYVNAVYLRGAEFLEALRGRIGDAAFFAFLKDYATQMAGRRATAEDFFRILRAHTSGDISDIIAAYFQNPH